MRKKAYVLLVVLAIILAFLVEFRPQLGEYGVAGDEDAENGRMESGAVSHVGPSRIPLRVLSSYYEGLGVYVTLGLPFPPGEIRSAGNVRVVDEEGLEVPVQCKVLSRWPDGSVMWLLLTFKWGGLAIYYVEYGGNVSPTPPSRPLRVEEGGGVLVVSTGPAKFVVNLSNGLLSAWGDSDGDGEPDSEFIAQLYSIVLGPGGEEFTSKNLEVRVEEAGPLRAVVVLKGLHVAGGKRSLNYTARLYFYQGESYVRIFYTEENSLPCLNNGAGQPNCLRLGSPNSIIFEDLSLVLSLPEEPYECAIPLGRLVVEESNSLVVYQDTSGGVDWDRWPGATFRGFKVYVDGEEKYSGERFEGWLDVRSRSGCLAVAVRYFWENYPKALEVSGDKVYVRLMPRYHSQPFEHRAGEHKTHEVILYLHPSSASEDVERVVKALLNPPYVRAPAEWYMYSGVFDYYEPYNPDVFKYYEANNLAAVNGSDGRYADNLFHARENVDFYGWMHFGDVRVVDEDGGTGQMNLQYDFTYGMIVQSLRLTWRENNYSYMWWLLAEQAARHQADIDVLHVHSGDPSQPSSYWIKWCWGGMFPHTPHEASGLENPHRGASPHLEYQWNRGLIYYYYLTGYEKALEVALEVSENTYWRVMNGPGEPGFSATTSDEARAPANALDILVNAYLLTGEEKYLEAAGKVVEESHFENKWYRSGPSEKYKSRTVAPWQVAMLMVSLGRYLDTVRLARGEIDERALSSLVGYADWMLKYCYHPHGDRASSKPHFIYRWRGDGAQIDWSPGAGSNAWQVKIGDAYAYAWIYTGNETYLKVALEQFECGSRYFWFEGNPVGRFATGKNHAILSTSGGVCMGVITGRIKPVVDYRGG